MTHRIFVTGATGTVGNAVMRSLSADSRDGRIALAGAARSPEAAERLRGQGFAAVEFDFDRPETLRPALRGVDAVFLATGYSVEMLVQSKRLLDAAAAEGVGHVVHLGAHAPADTPHAHFAWHQLVERAIQGMGFSFTHLHPNFFMDTVWQGFRHRPDRLVHFVGTRDVSWIAAEDIAAVAACALRDPARHAGQSYKLASECLSFPDLAALLSRETGREVRYTPRPAADLLPNLLRQGMEPSYAAGLADGVAAIEAGAFPGAAEVFDTVRTVTGRAPVTWVDFVRARRADLPDVTTSGRSAPS